MAYAESDANGQAQVAAFRQELAKLGWTEGPNFVLDIRYAGDDPERVRALARELLGKKPDLIVANSNLVTSILQSEVHDLPLLFISVSDPIGSGFVKDLSKPGGNVTGFANFPPSMGGKWLEKLREIAPQIERAALLYHREAPNIGYLHSAEATAPSLKIALVGVEVNNGTDIESGLAKFAGDPHGGLIVAPNVVAFANSGLIVSLAARYQLPAVYPFAFFAREGGLISYGFDAVEQFRQGAVYVDKILRGAKPADLPVQHPTKFETIINLKTANELGLTVPTQLVQFADSIIE
jgi:putative ABC transport system substrate-binding protein